MIDAGSIESLEFPKVLAAVARHIHGPATREAVMSLRPLTDADAIRERAALIGEFRRLMDEGIPISIQQFEDVRPYVESVRPEGSALEGEELLLFLPVFDSLLSLATLAGDHEEAPRLREAASSITGFPDLLDLIERSLDPDGKLKDTASYELGDIRRRIRTLTGRIRKRLEDMTHDENLVPFLQDTFVTQRSGRWVIPVRMDSKGMVKGVVHDVSRTGETAFMEPLDIIGLSNELENLIADERAEVIRILRAMSARLRAVADEVLAEFDILVYLDAMAGAATLARTLGMQAPTITDSPLLQLRNARHPLLVLQQKGDVVPLDVEIGGKQRVMAITGPNAGGKTIAIKTIGLLALMAQTGLHVPADSSSGFPVFSDVLVDIGDEQSIEDNLSTFSAHVSNISRILKAAGEQTLTLMDELGTGTDPGQGAALGSAILKDLMDKGALVFATTHLVDIVGFVHRTEGMSNASMAFDEETLTPLYRLKAGEPGQSHALAIAERFGLPRNVIEHAHELMGTMQADLHGLLRDLERRRVEYDDDLAEVRKERDMLKKRERELEDRLKKLDEEKRSIIENTYREAKTLLRDYKRKGLDALDEIKRSKSRAALKELEQEQQAVEDKLLAMVPEAEQGLDLEDIAIGDRVRLGALGVEAEVVAVDSEKGRVRVKAGQKELEVSAEGIQHAKKKKAEPAVRFAGRDIEETASDEIKLLGMRAEEAESALEAFINHASLAGLKEVRIVHGIGTGVLRKLVRDLLKRHPLIEEFRPGEQHEGGDGATIAKFR
jgi:DNA mismatch repair protein MutS2